MLLGEYSVRTGKTPQQHKSTYTINTRHSHRGSESGPASSHLVPQPLIRRWSDRRFKANGGKWSGEGQCLNVCRVGEERKSVSLHYSPGVDSSNSLAKATVGEPEKDKIVLSLGRVNAFQFCRLLSLSILVSNIINFLELLLDRIHIAIIVSVSMLTALPTASIIKLVRLWTAVPVFWIFR